MSAELYDLEYFTHHCGAVSYLDEQHFAPFFANVAAKLKERFPKTWSAFDAGCATGYLVEAFRDCGVPAWGVDSSEYAIANARPGAKDFLRCQSLLEPIEGRYDLLTCIEVLEHIPASDASDVIGNLCQASGNVIFSSTPNDLTEPTHVNVQPSEYWIELFAEQGFAREPTFDASFICPWALRFTPS